VLFCITPSRQFQATPKIPNPIAAAAAATAAAAAVQVKEYGERYHNVRIPSENVTASPSNRPQRFLFAHLKTVGDGSGGQRYARACGSA
jgi:hypothetical protein